MVEQRHAGTTSPNSPVDTKVTPWRGQELTPKKKVVSWYNEDPIRVGTFVSDDNLETEVVTTIVYLLEVKIRLKEIPCYCFFSRILVTFFISKRKMT